jgi:putative ABC transport system substrate-binding protein
LGGAAVMPLAARAQPSSMPVVGFLHSAVPFEEQAAAFRKGLKEIGFVDGQNITIEYRWAEVHADRLPGFAADLVARRVAVIAAIGGDVVALAAKAATTSIPIVFLNGSDPVRSGLVASINQPGGNVTGVSLFAGTVDAKRLELLHELVPRVTSVAVLNNGLVAETDARSKSLVDAAKGLGLQPVLFDINSEVGVDPAFVAIVNRKIGALFVSGSPFFISHRERLILLAAQHALPAVYAWREFATSGGLMSYGSNVIASSHQAGIYAGRILKGEKPADLPVLQPTKFEFVINLKTAKALGLTVPPGLLAIADEVIE